MLKCSFISENQTTRILEINMVPRLPYIYEMEEKNALHWKYILTWSLAKFQTPRNVFKILSRGKILNWPGPLKIAPLSRSSLYSLELQ